MSRSNRYDTSNGVGDEPLNRTSVKNQIRSVKRFLAKTNFKGPAAAKHEAKLKRLEALLVSNVEKKKTQEREQKFAKKYHKVKFFERVKVERKLKRMNKSTEVIDEEKKRKLGEDLVYIKHFPKGEKYISIFNEELTDLQKDK